MAEIRAEYANWRRIVAEAVANGTISVYSPAHDLLDRADTLMQAAIPDPSTPSMDIVVGQRLLQSLVECATKPHSSFTVEANHPNGITPLTVLVLTPELAAKILPQLP
jgi:hypothetical protein